MFLTERFDAVVRSDPQVGGRFDRHRYQRAPVA
jgi:hypothetical protein